MKLTIDVNGTMGLPNADYVGLIGDGVHDDTVAMEKAINQYNGIYLPNGIYLVTRKLNITVANYRIIGQDKINTIIKFVSEKKNDYLIQIAKATGVRDFLRGPFTHEYISFDMGTPNGGQISFGYAKPSDIDYIAKSSETEKWETVTDGGEQYYINNVSFNECSFLGFDERNNDESSVSQVLLTRIKCFESKVTNCSFRFGDVANLKYGCDAPFDSNNKYTLCNIGTYHRSSGTFGVNYTEENGWYGGNRDSAIVNVGGTLMTTLMNNRVEASGNSELNSEESTYTVNITSGGLVTGDLINFRPFVTLFRFTHPEFGVIYTTLKYDGEDIKLDSLVSFYSDLVGVVLTKCSYVGLLSNNILQLNAVNVDTYCKNSIAVNLTESNKYVVLDNCRLAKSSVNINVNKNYIICGNVKIANNIKMVNCQLGIVMNSHPMTSNNTNKVCPVSHETIFLNSANATGNPIISKIYHNSKDLWGIRVPATRNTGRKPINFKIDNYGATNFAEEDTTTISVMIYNPTLSTDKINIGNPLGLFSKKVNLTGVLFEKIAVEIEKGVFDFDYTNPNATIVQVYKYDDLSDVSLYVLYLEIFKT